MKKSIAREYITALLLALTGMLLIGLLLRVNTIPANDTAVRYAPMARAFAEGNYAYAYHPHSGVLFSTLAGGIARLSGVDGFRACQGAALMFWGFAVIPLYFIILRMWQKRRIALLGGILYLFCSHLPRYVYDGVRDNGRSLGFFLLVLGLLIFYENRRSWRAVLTVAAGAALLTMLRVDGPLIAAAGILCFAVWDIAGNRRDIRRSIALLLLTMVLISPQLYR